MAYKAIIDVFLTEENKEIKVGEKYEPVNEKRTAQLLGPFNDLGKPVIVWVDEEKPKAKAKKVNEKEG